MGGHHTSKHPGWKDVWLTPPEIVAALGPFDLDPCAAPEPRPWPTAKRMITLPENGLLSRWSAGEMVWMNPPYGARVGRWLRRLSLHGNGLALVFARTETAAWHDWVWMRAAAVGFIAGRINFYHGSGRRSRSNCGAPVALIAYGEKAAGRLALYPGRLAIVRPELRMVG